MFEPGGDVERRRVQRLQGPRGRPAEARRRIVRRAFRPRVDEVEHGLRRAKVEPPVQERPFRELAPPGEPRARRKARLQHTARRKAAAVSLQLDHVLARVAARGGEDEHEAVVERPRSARRAEGRVEEPPGVRGVHGAARERGGDAEGRRTAHAHDGDAAPSRRRREGGNRVPARHDATPKSHMAKPTSGGIVRIERSVVDETSPTESATSRP